MFAHPSAGERLLCGQPREGKAATKTGAKINPSGRENNRVKAAAEPDWRAGEESGAGARLGARWASNE